MQKMEVEKGSEAHHPEPEDNCRLGYLIHFLLGAGNLLPWNAYITAMDYFGSLYPTKHIAKVFSVAYMGSSLLVLLGVLGSSGWSMKLTYRMRMNVGFSMFATSLMVVPVIDWTWTDDESDGRRYGSFAVVVASVVVCGLADGLVGGSLVASSGKLPKQYMQAVFAGTASSGVLVSSLRIVTKASLPQNRRGLETSAHFYFIISISVILFCTICCNVLHKLPVMVHYNKLHPDDFSYPRQNLLAAARKIQWPAIGIMTIYVVTLSIFPGFIAENVSSKQLQDWYPVLLITVYNVSDFVGKSLTAIYIPRSIRKATWVSFLRLLFYPLFAACLHGPKWLKTEVPVVILTFVLGVTNGYLTSVIMILTPKSVPVAEAELSAIVLLVFLGFGLVGGSVLGWFWVI